MRVLPKAEGRVKLILSAGSIVSLFLLGGCAHQPKGATANAAKEQAVQVHTKYRDAWRSRDISGIANAMSTKATFTSPNVGQPLSREQYAGYLQQLFKAVPDFTVQKSEGGMVDADTMAEEWLVTGTWTQPWTSGPLAGMAPTGKSFVLPGANIIEFKDGKIDSVTQYFDNLMLLTQIGVIQPK